MGACGTAFAPPASTTSSPSPARTSLTSSPGRSSSSGRSGYHAGSASLSALGDGRGLRARRRLAAVGRPRGHRRRARVPGVVASRPRDRWYFLLVGAAVLLAWNPYSLLEPGFQLSFSAVAAIFLLVPWVSRRLEGYPIPEAPCRCDLDLGRLRTRDRAGPLAPLRRHPGLRGSRERTRRTRRRAASRLRAGCGRARTRTTGGSRGARLGRRVARRLPGSVRAPRREPSLRPGELAAGPRSAGRGWAAWSLFVAHARVRCSGARPPWRA